VEHKKSAKITSPVVTVEDLTLLQDQVDSLKDNLAFLTETVQCLPLNEPVSIPGDPDEIGFPGGFISTPRGEKLLKGVGLVTCRSYRVWRNRTAAARNRTVEVRPIGLVFPKGSTVTIFTGADNLEGKAPPAGAPSVVVGQRGDEVEVSVPANQAVFVHFKTGGYPNNIRTNISQKA